MNDGKAATVRATENGNGKNGYQKMSDGITSFPFCVAHFPVAVFFRCVLAITLILYFPGDYLGGGSSSGEKRKSPSCVRDIAPVRTGGRSPPPEAGNLSQTVPQ